MCRPTTPRPAFRYENLSVPPPRQRMPRHDRVVAQLEGSFEAFLPPRTGERLPSWVIRVALTLYLRLPLCPYKQTSLPSVGMSRMCQQRTLWPTLPARQLWANRAHDHLSPATVLGLWVPDRMAVATANLFSNKDMRLYLPLSVGLEFKESHSAAGNWRRLLIHH